MKNEIIYLSDNEFDEYLNMQDRLKGNHGYLDIIVDFNDFDKLKFLLKDTFNLEQQEKIEKLIMTEYLYYSILNSAHIPVDNNVFDKNYNEFIQSHKIEYINMLDSIKEKAYKQSDRKLARIHLFINNVYNIALQEAINELLKYSTVPIILYTTRDLVTYNINSDNKLEEKIDYKKFLTNERKKEENEKDIRRR